MNMLQTDMFDLTSIEREMRGALEPGRRSAYALAGDATLTIKNPATGTRFTYRVRESKNNHEVRFVTVLTGPDNESHYRYIGRIHRDRFALTPKSEISSDAPSVVAFSWFMNHMEDARIEVWHEGTCGRCGRKLTVPESIATGLGPTCAEIMR